MTVPLFMVPLEIPVTLDGEKTILVFKRPTPEQSIRASALRWKIAQAGASMENKLDRNLAAAVAETEHGMEYVELIKECLVGVKSPAGESWPGALEAVKESDLLALVRAEVCARLFFRDENFSEPGGNGHGGSEGGQSSGEGGEDADLSGLRDAGESGDV